MKLKKDLPALKEKILEAKKRAVSQVKKEKVELTRENNAAINDLKKKLATKEQGLNKMEPNSEA